MFVVDNACLQAGQSTGWNSINMREILAYLHRKWLILRSILLFTYALICLCSYISVYQLICDKGFCTPYFIYLVSEVRQLIGIVVLNNWMWYYYFCFAAFIKTHIISTKLIYSTSINILFVPTSLMVFNIFNNSKVYIILREHMQLVDNVIFA